MSCDDQTMRSTAPSTTTGMARTSYQPMRAVRPVAGVLVVDGLARGDDLVELPGQPRGRVVADGELPDLAADDLPVGEERDDAVAEEDRPVRVDDEHDVGRRLDERPPEHALPLATVRSHRRAMLDRAGTCHERRIAISAERYDPAAIEPKWQSYWDEHQTFRAERHAGTKKLYVLDMFPYPSGSGLHVGHPEGYTATDIVARYWRMRGVDVLHPMGWDAFGLPAEQHAIATNTHPRDTTAKNIATFKRQLKMLGFSYDWSREIDTTDPGVREVDAVDLPQALPSGAWPTRRRSPSTGARRSGRCSRTRRSSTARASGGNHPVERAAAAAVDAQDHRLRRPARRRPRGARLARHEGEAAPLDRPQRGGRDRLRRRRRRASDHPRLHDARRHAARASRTSCSRPEHPLVEKLVSKEQQAGRCGRTSRRRATRATATAPRPRRRRASPLGATATNPVNGERGPHLGGRLRHRDVRHGRRHGRARARRARPRVRARVRAAHRAGDRAGRRRRRSTCRRRPTPTTARRSYGRVDVDVKSGTPSAEARATHHGVARGARARGARRSPTSCATGSSRGSATGASPSPSTSR